MAQSDMTVIAAAALLASRWRLACCARDVL